VPIAPDEVKQRFGVAFTIQRIAGADTPALEAHPRFAAYLMTARH
jgi:hypothetical protein